MHRIPLGTKEGLVSPCPALNEKYLITTSLSTWFLLVWCILRHTISWNGIKKYRLLSCVVWWSRNSKSLMRISFSFSTDETFSISLLAAYSWSLDWVRLVRALHSSDVHKIIVFAILEPLPYWCQTGVFIFAWSYIRYHCKMGNLHSRPTKLKNDDKCAVINHLNMFTGIVAMHTRWENKGKT